jgi:hypothetical protein
MMSIFLFVENHISGLVAQNAASGLGGRHRGLLWGHVDFDRKVIHVRQRGADR